MRGREGKKRRTGQALRSGLYSRRPRPLHPKLTEARASQGNDRGSGRPGDGRSGAHEGFAVSFWRLGNEFCFRTSGTNVCWCAWNRGNRGDRDRAWPLPLRRLCPVFFFRWRSAAPFCLCLPPPTAGARPLPRGRTSGPLRGHTHPSPPPVKPPPAWQGSGHRGPARAEEKHCNAGFRRRRTMEAFGDGDRAAWCVCATRALAGVAAWVLMLLWVGWVAGGYRVGAGALRTLTADTRLGPRRLFFFFSSFVDRRTCPRPIFHAPSHAHTHTGPTWTRRSPPSSTAALTCHARRRRRLTWSSCGARQGWCVFSFSFSGRAFLKAFGCNPGAAAA